jgi:hypothetical protein
MKRSVLAWTVSAVTISLMSALPALAAQHGHSGPPNVKQPRPAGVVAHGGGSTKTHTTTQAGHGHAGANAATKAPKAMKAPKAPKAPKPTKTTKVTKAKTNAKATSTKTTRTTDPATITLSPVQQKLQRNTNLADKLRSRLPAGTDLLAASADFRNLGQFVAAVNVSNNLGLKFTDLKTRMVDEHMSLGQAIQDVRGGTDGQVVALRAEQDADRLIRSTDASTTTTTTAKPNGKSKAKPRKTQGTV